MRRARRVNWIAQLLVLSVGLSTTLPVVAQEDAELARARASFQQAVELEQAGNCPAALNLFRQVGQIRMTPQVRFHIAACEAQLGRLVAALGGFQLALADADSVGKGFRDEVEENARRLRERIPKLTLKRGEGAETATISIDGTVVGDNSIGVEVPLDPGPHAISASASGYNPFEQTVTLTEGGSETLEIVLSPAPRVDLSPGDPSTRVEGPRSKVPAYVLGGFGIASLAGAGVMFYFRQKSVGKLDDACPDRECAYVEDPTDPTAGRKRIEDLKDEEQKLKIFHYGSIAAAGVGVVAVGAAASLLLGVWEPSLKEARVSVRPTLAPNLAAADVTVRF